MTSSVRFWAKVAKSEGCWEWTGSRSDEGYGRFWPIPGGQRVAAHRFSWTIANGPIPSGLLVCHHCDNPPCVRPDHLFIGTVRDNNLDRERKGRSWQSAPTCRRGHLLADNAYVYRGARHCRVCRNRRAAIYRARDREASRAA